MYISYEISGLLLRSASYLSLAAVWLKDIVSNSYATYDAYIDLVLLFLFFFIGGVPYYFEFDTLLYRQR
jgi:hypothetical protein